MKLALFRDPGLIYEDYGTIIDAMSSSIDNITEWLGWSRTEYTEYLSKDPRIVGDRLLYRVQEMGIL